MRVLSYTVTPVLQQNLKEIESLRAKILLHPLSQAAEINLRWEAALSRIYFSLHLAHNPVTEKEIIRALRSPGRQHLLPAEKEIINYKQGFDYFVREWLVNQKPVMPQAVNTLYRIVTEDKTKLPENELMEVLVFLQTSREHPLIQAFIAFIQFSLVLPADDASGRVCRLLPYIFLYKNGLDFRGLLVLEEYFYRNERLVRELIQAVTRGESVNVWVEHFIRSIASQLEETGKRILQLHDDGLTAKSAQLSERQKEILTAFDQPGMRITNRKVQQVFRVSQITASRDLAKLAALGLLFTYGKGRSVYYMKA